MPGELALAAIEEVDGGELALWIKRARALPPRARRGSPGAAP
jgi:hypothetical protein